MEAFELTEIDICPLKAKKIDFLHELHTIARQTLQTWKRETNKWQWISL